MEFVSIKCRVRRKSNSFWWCKRNSSIWSDSREHSENVIVKLHVHCSGIPDWQQKHSSNALVNQTRSQNSAYTTRKSLIFCVLCALFEQIPFGMNRDILKHPTLCGDKNRTNSVIWSRGVPNLMMSDQDLVFSSRSFVLLCVHYFQMQYFQVVLERTSCI